MTAHVQVSNSMNTWSVQCFGEGWSASRARDYRGRLEHSFCFGRTTHQAGDEKLGAGKSGSALKSSLALLKFSLSTDLL